MFNLAIAKNELLPRLLMLAGAVDRRQALAILSNVLLTLHQNRLTITATDLEIEMSTTFVFANLGTDGAITIPAKKFIDIIRSLDDNTTAVIKMATDSVKIKAGRSQFKLATLPAEQFPISHELNVDLSFSMPRLDFLRLLQATHFAMSQQDVRIFLNGLLLEFDNHWLKAIATDGHRMAICELPIEKHHELMRFLIPRKSIQEMIRLLNSIADELIEIRAGKQQVSIVSNDYHFTSKLVDARFPPYIKAIPTDSDKFILIDRDILKRSLARTVILAHEKSKAVMIQIKANTLTLIANNQDQEEAKESVEAQVDGTEIKVGINASYLLDVLNSITEGMLRFSLTTADRSILIESLNNEHAKYIIMPMKL